MDTELHVAVAVVQAPDGRVLVAHRDARRHEGGRLELPGGKIEAGEAPERALARELAEELGIGVRQTRPLMRVRHRYSDRRVELHVYRVTGWSCTPGGREGQALEWRMPDALAPAQFPAANRPILAALQLPACSLVTPTPPDGSDAAVGRLAEGVEAALEAAGPLLVRLRAPGLRREAWARHVDALAAVVAQHEGSRLLATAPPARAAALPAGVGLHLAAADAARLETRPVGDERLLSCACHDAAELARAEALGADLAYLGPVAATATHPAARPLGWARFAELAAGTTLPLYALGGIGRDELDVAREAGAVGVAGIRAFWPGAGW